MRYKKKFSAKMTHVDYFLHQKEVYFKEGNSIIKIDEFLNRETFFIKENPFIIESIVNDKLCIRDKISLTYINLNSGIISKTIPLKFQNPIQIKYQDSNFLILRNQISEDVWKIFCIDNDGNIIWEKDDNRPFFAYGISSQYLIYSFLEIKKMAMKSIADNETIWEIEFENLTDSDVVYNYTQLLESNQKLYFILGSKNRERVFCIDIKDGKEVILHDKCFGFLVKDNDFLYSSKFENILCKINLSNNEIEEWDVNQILKDNDFEAIHDHRCTAYNGFVYFTQTIGDTKAKLGILDTYKNELVYKYEFEPMNGGIGSIQINNGRLFVSTQDNTLYVFDQEE